ncbi:HTH-like domain-containing protein [Thalassospira marina]|uniref:HTH-like domain-containing protein n=2 Tax=Thalassospira marina TaxID=2048283 RepID=A0A2N3KQY8_9PROT|nr:hypothetical protein [Thalassospira marina]AUG55539.1 hypothetical protein CSC3H3_22020 [Thalassospira marina]PKR52967.1 hypothetical protein COO20_16870 [Thalassospira marina]
MNERDLVNVLNEMYEGAASGEAAVMVHLFGIKYANQIKAADTSPSRLAKLSNVPDSYGVEINKGVNLSKFVSVK